MTRYVIPFEQLRMTDVGEVGGKNASLGEMISQLSATGVRVPGGFATTADAYREFLSHQGLADRINAALDALNVDDVDALLKTGAQIRQWLIDTPFPAALEAETRWWHVQDRVALHVTDAASPGIHEVSVSFRLEVPYLDGGPDGLDPALRQGAHERLRLSDLTLPHALARVLLVGVTSAGGRKLMRGLISQIAVACSLRFRNHLAP